MKWVYECIHTISGFIIVFDIYKKIATYKTVFQSKGREDKNNLIYKSLSFYSRK